MALLIVVCGLAAGLWRLAHRQRIPDHLLFLTLGVWIPLLQIGCFQWNPEQRYVEGQMLPLLLGAFAIGQWGCATLASRVNVPSLRMGTAAAALLCILVIDPMRLRAAVNPTYANYPDHQGAAQFVESLHPAPGDIIVAEDPLVQTYYLGHVDYWLEDRREAATFLRKVDGRWVDEYTDTPLIGSGAQLERLVNSRDRGAIYVIGSGENADDRNRVMRGRGIEQALDSPAFHLVYVGRDRLTDVWKVDPPGRSLAAAVRAVPDR